jgi:hypothetical protein
MIKVIDLLDSAKREVEDAGREIYYAMSNLPSNHIARVNLRAALRALGIDKPTDVGLSNSVLTRHEENASPEYRKLGVLDPRD